MVGEQVFCPNPGVEPLWPLRENLFCRHEEGNCLRRQRKPLLQFGMCGGIDKLTGGTANQFYCLVAGLAIAHSLGADVILPNLQERASFGHNQSQIAWQKLALDSLYDVEHLRTYWKRRGMAVYTQEDLRQMHRTVESIVAPQYMMGKDLKYWTERLLYAVDPCGTTLFQFDCILFALSARTNIELIEEVSASLRFAANSRAANTAARILTKLQQLALQETGSSSFDALHLRVEADAHVWNTPVREQLDEALSTVTSIGMGGIVYVASGLWNYPNNNSDFVLDELQQRVPGSIWTKKLLLDAETFAALNSEEHAVVDILICVNARKFAGYGMSSFSFYIGERRQILRQKKPLGQELSTAYYGFMGREFLENALLSRYGQSRRRMSHVFN